MEASEAAKVKGALYEKYFIRRQYDGLDLEAALDLYESFHILEALPEKWSDNHLFKCNCEAGFKNASCHHVLMASWVVDSSAQIPDRYLGMHVQQRRKRGRPSKKPSELGDAGEARCRARLKLQAQYKVPQVQKFVFVTGPIHVDIVDHGRLTWNWRLCRRRTRMISLRQVRGQQPQQSMLHPSNRLLQRPQRCTE